ncbi:MAG: hypothetical protein KC800_24280 [Candidatus Eremiobacteraeota bacterium]|nr:hypothetical protein [Candidatus Eremiobacteraeota bacterium]
MSVEKYLENQKKSGDFESTGRFTLDLRAAATKMDRYRLPTEEHQLLKVLQTAVSLSAQELRVELGLRQSTATFASSASASHLLQSEMDALATAGAADRPGHPLAFSLFMSGLSTGLGGIEWRMSQGSACRTLRLEGGGNLESLGPKLPKGEICHEVNLTHSSGWKLWEGLGRRHRASNLLSEWARFAPLDLRVNGKKLDRADPAAINDHVSDFGGSQFNVATGVMQNTRRPAASSNLLFLLGSGPCIRVMKPPLEAYIEKDGAVVWAQGRRIPGAISDAGQKPDGLEVSSWMLQFVRDGENLGLDALVKGETLDCMAVVAQNIHGPGNSEGVRVTVVRDGVTILEARETSDTPGLEDLIGCSLLFADNELDTDLGGLALVRNEKYYRKLRSFAPVIERGHRYFQEGSRFLSIS